MAAEAFVISNPRGNNVTLVVTAPGGGHGAKTLATVRPGESYQVDQPLVRIKVVALPARLQLHEDGTVGPDTRKTSPRLSRKL